VDIELRHLRSFVAVAEELNFTRAAKRLFIAQQALSAQIRQLEDRIGTKLLDRDTRSVSLTEAGEVLLGQARLLLADADTAIAVTRAASTTTTRLTVGFVAAVNHPSMALALDRFSDDHPTWS
jgi:DNA-binding transcriptional LysR family regulator